MSTFFPTVQIVENSSIDEAILIRLLKLNNVLLIATKIIMCLLMCYFETNNDL